MNDLLPMLGEFAQCTAVIDDGALPVSLFIAGALGGLTHCTGMCGPFVLAQVGSRLEATPVARMSEWHRLSGAALLPYHLGRATTYALLGALGALVAGRIADIAGLRWFSSVLLLAAALLMAGMAIPQLKRLFQRGASGETAWGSRLGRFAAPLFASPTGWRGYLLGVILGFLPCGMVIGAVTAAAAAQSPLQGALAMAAFAAGTVPALLVVGLAGHVAGTRFRLAASWVAPALLLLNAGVLTMLALRPVV